MKIISKKDVNNHLTKLTSGKSYEFTISDYTWGHHRYMQFYDDNDTKKILKEDELPDYFFTETEYRKKKLKKLEKICQK